MKTKWCAILAILSFFWVGRLTAQDWSDYRQLFGLLSKEEQDLFREQLKELMAGLDRGSNAQAGIFKALGESLPGITNPTAGITAMLNELAFGRDSLAAILQANNLLSGDASILMGIFDAGNTAWVSQLGAIQEEFDEAKSTFNQADQLMLFRARRAFQSADGERRSAMSASLREFNAALNMAQGEGGDGNLNALLEVGTLEAGAGVQNGTATYYSFAPDAGQFALIRFGSAPNYDRLWGMEWDSWISIAPPGRQQSSAGGENIVQQTEPSAYPVLTGGSLSFQYRPYLGFFGGRVRLIAGVGAKADTYIPKRIITGIPETFDNEGKTTGIGPNARLGFSVSSGAGLTFYAVSNTARGFVIRCPDYPYVSNQLTSGVYWGKYHFRVSTGNTRWAINQRRLAQFAEASFNIALSGN